MNKMKKIVLLFTLAFIILSMASCDLLRDYYDEYEHVHTYSDWVITKEASCFEEGIQTRICNNCDQTQTLPISAGHRWQSEWTIIKEATCTENGLREIICDSCQAKESEAIAVLTSHPWGAWTITKEATCTEDGSKERTCSSCNEKQIETVVASAHTFINGVCSKCNALRMSNIILPEPPITLYTLYSDSRTSITITSLRIEIDESYSTEYVEIYYTAEKTYDYYGASSMTSCRFIYKLYDSQGYVVRQGTVYHSDLVVGDKVTGSFSLGKLSKFDPNETYTLVLIDDT